MNGSENVKRQQYAPSPPDFNEGGSEYRRNLLLSTSIAIVLLLSTSLNPEVLGIKVPENVMWSLLGLAHVYFFVMWRLTAVVEGDMDKKFWNFKGLYVQAFGLGRPNSPGKVKAQIFFIRSLPIWAFFIGLISISIGL
ncbi:hypothetical protein HRH59_18305 [Rheinheimera sp. YQF-2]|uniref:Uncharacterized protein n=1 Tax=Rheinheimera lutimaris TaxID=2740584 RepID=A0A7Y5AV65_9GAMM|nr:hypothetical protein [Rheinheimera lutimaris]NRQ44496.1 hypothetical protein [Rheinheimera lutimaris]